MHVWHAATPCPQLHVFQARRHLPCDTRGPCVRAFPGAARSPDASTSGQSGGYQTVAGCSPAPPPSHGRPMRGVRDLAFPSWHFWAGLQGVTHLYASLARRLSSALLPPSPQAERDSCVGFCLQPGPPILPSFVTRASPWPLWELGFCLWDEGAEPGKPRVPAGVSHSPPHHCAGLLSGITTPHQESEWRWVLA